MLVSLVWHKELGLIGPMRKDEQSESSGNICMSSKTHIMLVIMCNERLDTLEKQHIVGILHVS